MTDEISDGVKAMLRAATERMGGDLTAAIRELAVAETWARRNEDAQLLAAVLIQKAGWLRDGGRNGSRKALDEAVRLLQDNTAEALQALVPALRLERSREALARGNFDEAEGLLQSAEAALSGAPQPIFMSDIRQNQASILLYRGKFTEALIRIGEAEKLDRELGNTQALANDLTVTGSIYEAMGDHEAATRVLRQAIQVAVDQRHWKEAADAATNLAQSMDRQGESESARDLLSATLEQYRDLGELRAATNVLSSLAIISSKLGDSTAARDQLEEVVRLRKELGDFPYVLYDELNLASVVSFSDVNAGIAGASRLVSEADKHGLLNLSWMAQALLAHCSLKQLADTEDPNEKKRLIEQDVLPNLDRALDIIESLRGGIASPDDRRFVLGDKQWVYEQAVSAAFSIGNVPLAHAFCERSRARAFVETIRRGSRNQADSPVVAPLGIEAVSARLPDQSVLLAYFIGESYSALFPITTKGLEGALLLPQLGRQRVTQLVNHAREEIAQESPTLSACEELATLLLDPVESVTSRARHLILVPHGPLHYLPFAALVVKDGKGKRGYLTELHQLSYIPAASLIELCLDMPRPNFTLANAVVIGNPQDDLPESEREAVDVAAQLGVAPILRNKATRDHLLKAPPRLSFVHVSCHGSYDVHSPLDSYLDLADGPVTARDLMSIDLGAGLLALSACLTGMSSVLAGDEIVGLIRAGFEARVPTIITALTEIWEDSSRVFFGVFYRQLRVGRSTLQAFSDAVAVVRSTPEFSQPVHWAPYLLAGDWT